jgi:diadenosine tetraphosphate (Ap4A) HIT family hydrolase
MIFQLHPQLKQDSIRIGQLSLSQLLLINDSHYPWFVLVPERLNITEIYQLSKADQQQLNFESTLLSQTLAELYRADKMNIAAIGNLVPQLHIHHIVRYKNDIAWPAPVWGKFDAESYTEQHLKLIKTQMHNALKDHLN